ncbi:flagellar motor protein MotB [Sandarakinorhabdus sp.]|uniref:flagellar motor protein MotB n=1 Tax=Sandarakinorhabdus sp. TaxID=1916663 RepID=UPI00333F05A7
MKPEGKIEPEIIIKKVKSHGHAHHGGAWKIAYADFVTAMMAFFMLLWILGATNEQQRKGIADYFSPTMIQMQATGGSNGLFGGRSVETPDGAMERPETKGQRPVMSGGSGGTKQAGGADGNGKDSKAKDNARFEKIARNLQARLEADPTLKGLQGQVKFVRTRDGLRIDLVERADFSMFALGTSAPTTAAGALVQTVAHAIEGTPNNLAVRGHTDALGFKGPGGPSNWSLSTTRADATRRLLMGAGIPSSRFRRIEGVADTDPFVKADPADPRNRRISITLLYEDPA